METVTNRVFIIGKVTKKTRSVDAPPRYEHIQVLEDGTCIFRGMRLIRCSAYDGRSWNAYHVPETEHLIYLDPEEVKNAIRKAR